MPARSAPPLIPSGDFSPWNGEKEDGRDDGAHPATLAIGESLNASVLLPTCGEKMAAAR
jgi:hypothetical protein